MNIDTSLSKFYTLLGKGNFSDYIEAIPTAIEIALLVIKNSASEAATKVHLGFQRCFIATHLKTDISDKSKIYKSVAACSAIATGAAGIAYYFYQNSLQSVADAVQKDTPGMLLGPLPAAFCTIGLLFIIRELNKRIGAVSAANAPLPPAPIPNALPPEPQPTAANAPLPEMAPSALPNVPTTNLMASAQIQQLQPQIRPYLPLDWDRDQDRITSFFNALSANPPPKELVWPYNYRDEDYKNIQYRATIKSETESTSTLIRFHDFTSTGEVITLFKCFHWNIDFCTDLAGDEIMMDIFDHLESKMPLVITRFKKQKINTKRAYPAGHPYYLTVRDFPVANAPLPVPAAVVPPPDSVSNVPPLRRPAFLPLDQQRDMDKLVAFKGQLESDAENLMFPNHLDFSKDWENRACSTQRFKILSCNTRPKYIDIPMLSTVNELMETFKFCGYKMEFLRYMTPLTFDGKKTIEETLPGCDHTTPRLRLIPIL